VHLLVRFGRTTSISDWVKEVKRVSSSFAKQTTPEFQWQAGYGVFSVSASHLDQAAAYVRNQEEHHKRESFQEEFLRLLAEHGMEWDARYVWD
jgi:putative transposase